MLALEYMHKQRCTAHVVYIERLKHHKTCMHAVIGGLLVSQCSEKGKLSKMSDQCMLHLVTGTVPEQVLVENTLVARPVAPSVHLHSLYGTLMSA